MPEAGAAAANEARQEGADEDTGDDVPPTKAPRSRWLDEEPEEEPEALLNKVRQLAASEAAAPQTQVQNVCGVASQHTGLQARVPSWQPCAIMQCATLCTM